MLTVVFTVICCLLIAQGALQCFDPAKLNRIQARFTPRSVDWNASAGGTFFERLRRQSAKPSLLNRLAGVLMMVAGVYMLLAVLGFLGYHR